MIITRKQIVKVKLQQIISGYCAYVETKEAAAMLKKEIKLLNLDVYEDCTEIGSWFIPVKERSESQSN
ncbi:hypothetical protein ACOI1C_15995 [Bacillus sp. DJP31]|uniref:hypothetical protein n=1 Tax=Bacillus sp. DJP31 TaxID=3409789 RepID=UPI003BB62906